MPDIIDYLVDKQAALGMNEAAFSAYLKMDLSTWLRYKRRERVGDQLRLVQLAAVHWPDEQPAIFGAALRSRTQGGVRV